MTDEIDSTEPYPGTTSYRVGRPARTGNAGVRVTGPVDNLLVLPPAGTQVRVYGLLDTDDEMQLIGDFAGMVAATDGEVAIPVAVDLRRPRTDGFGEHIGWDVTLVPWHAIGCITWGVDDDGNVVG